MRGAAEAHAGRAAGRAASPRDLPALLVLPALALAALGVIYPIALAVWNSFTRAEGDSGAYAWIVSNPVYVDIILRTFTTAFVTVAICILLGYPFAYVMAVSGPRARLILFVIALLPFWVSGLVRVFAWVVLLQAGGPVSQLFGLSPEQSLLGTTIGVQIGLVQVLLPFLIIPLFTVMRGIDLNLVRAAESLGARPSAAFAQVFLPLSLPGVFAGALIVFVLALGFYVLPAILGSPQQAMVGSVIYTQTSTLGNIGRAGALSTVLLALTLLIILGGYLVRRRYLKGA